MFCNLNGNKNIQPLLLSNLHLTPSFQGTINDSVSYLRHLKRNLD